MGSLAQGYHTVVTPDPAHWVAGKGTDNAPMGHEAPIRDAGGNRLWRMLGLGTREEDLRPAPRSGSRLAQRAALLDAIAEFLLRHDLAVSLENLKRAHAIVSGTNPRLARRVAALEDAGEPVTQDWLDLQNTAGDGTRDPADELEELTLALDKSMADFGETTRSATQAATFYRGALQDHVAKVGEATEEETVVASLAHIAHAMLDRTREMEAEMRRSEEEARLLRRNLEQARRDATIDHLTNLPNRRAFEQVFEREWLAAQREMEPLCLALCDIDLFKKVNDMHGHDTGDRVIRAVGQALDRISDNCHVARHGGEEFVLLFRGLDLAGATRMLDAARERMANRHFVDKVSGKPIGGVTFSGGVTDVFAHPDLSGALRAADEALYRAKEAGRNRIEQG